MVPVTRWVCPGSVGGAGEASRRPHGSRPRGIREPWGEARSPLLHVWSRRFHCDRRSPRPGASGSSGDCRCQYRPVPGSAHSPPPDGGRGRASTAGRGQGALPAGGHVARLHAPSSRALAERRATTWRRRSAGCMRRLGEPSTPVCGEHPAPAAVHGLSRPGSAPRSASSAGCPAPATRPVRALRRGPVACQLPTGLASRSRGACGLTPCWGRWKRPFDFPILLG